MPEKGLGQVFTSNLPIVVIDTDGSEIPDEPKIISYMGIIYNGEGNQNSINEPHNHYSGLIGIETRGNSTQDFEKKSYGLETRDIFEEDSAVSLFGMGKDEDWILHAMVIDKSLLRIPLSFHLAQQSGQYASEWKYVELFIDEDYQGVYILTERIKRDDDRVDIAKMEVSDVSGDEVTGGYILRLNWLDGSEGFRSDYNSKGGQKLLFQWYYPKAENLVSAQRNYIQDWMAEFEEALFSDNFYNSQGKRYSEYIDLKAFADFFLINEFSKNSDGYKLSTYIHKDRDSRDGRLKAGPIWDFDQTYGLSIVCSSHITDGWLYLQNQSACGDLESMPLWWEQLMTDSRFTRELKCQWNELREGPYHRDSIMSWIDEHAEMIREARIRNFEKWDFIGERIWIEPDNFPQTYDEEISYLKNWIDQRLAWLDNNIPGNCNDVVTGLDLSVENKITLFPNPAGNRVNIEGSFNELRIFNSTGAEIAKFSRQNQGMKLDISNYTPGLYFFVFDDGAQKSILIKE